MSLRRSFTVAQKLKVVKCASQWGQRKAVSLFQLAPSMVSRWCKSIEKLNCTPKSVRRIGSGRRPRHPDAENLLSIWVKDERSKGLAVTLSDVCVRMRSLTSAKDGRTPNTFKASSGWLYGFLRRCKLSLRQITTLKKRPSCNASFHRTHASVLGEFKVAIAEAKEMISVNTM